jgi:hypothetical protein
MESLDQPGIGYMRIVKSSKDSCIDAAWIAWLSAAFWPRYQSRPWDAGYLISD